MKVFWSPQARQDLREIYLYLAAENPNAARALQQRIKQAVSLLRENPQIGRAWRVPGTREFAVSGTSYILPYQIWDRRLELPRWITYKRGEGIRSQGRDGNDGVKSPVLRPCST